MNSLGAQGWIINDGVYVDSGAPNGVDAEIEVQASPPGILVAFHPASVH